MLFSFINSKIGLKIGLIIFKIEKVKVFVVLRLLCLVNDFDGIICDKLRIWYWEVLV